MALITIASTPVAIIMLSCHFEIGRKPQQRKLGELNAYMDEYLWTKSSYRSRYQEDVIAGLLSKMGRFEKPLLRKRMFSGILFPVMENGMSLVNMAVVIFVGSAVLLNDKNIETLTALGLIVMFTRFFTP